MVGACVGGLMLALGLLSQHPCGVQLLASRVHVHTIWFGLGLPLAVAANVVVFSAKCETEYWIWNVVRRCVFSRSYYYEL
jgi:hypothetical protein